MNEDIESGQPEGEALPESLPPPLPAHAANGLHERLLDAIERWYAAHFHAAAVAGRAPITADDKAALVSSVTAVVAPSKE